MNSMNRGGPKEGLQARAMAATRYDVRWNMDWDKSGGACRLRSATPVLAINYRFPKLTSRVSPDLKQRWDKFMVGVRAHEQVHGKIAQDMANAAQAALAGIAINNDPNCTKAQAEVQRRVRGVYSEYEGRQRAFDAREHRPGGNVERLVGDFMRG
jgi:predicted secreted Zn-dependent protease